MAKAIDIIVGINALCGIIAVVTIRSWHKRARTKAKEFLHMEDDNEGEK